MSGGPLAVIALWGALTVACLAAFLTGIWTGDDRWLQTGAALLVPTFGLMVAVAAVGGDL